MRKAAAPRTGGEMIAPSPPADQQSASGVLFVPCLGQQRVSHRTDRDSGRDAGARRATKQEGRQHDSAAG